MLNDEINKYKDLYAQLVNEFAGLHNENLVFIKTRGRIPGYGSRKHLRAIEDLAKQLKKQGQLVCKEHLANLKLAKKLEKEEKRKNKNVRSNKSTQNTI
jgi:hypothetical protein